MIGGPTTGSRQVGIGGIDGDISMSEAVRHQRHGLGALVITDGIIPTDALFFNALGLARYSLHWLLQWLCLISSKT